MRFETLSIPDLWLIRPQRHGDDRGFFVRTFCEEEFADHGLPTRFPQSNVSFNVRRGTLRGLHWQSAPHEEGKLVRCTRGQVLDVAVDLRPGSATRGRWVGVLLSGRGGEAIYIPPGFAHGFQTMEDDTEVSYLMTVPYRAGLARGLRWDDPALGIDWPLPDPVVSPRDAALPVMAALVPEGAS